MGKNNKRYSKSTGNKHSFRKGFPIFHYLLGGVSRYRCGINLWPTRNDHAGCYFKSRKTPKGRFIQLFFVTAQTFHSPLSNNALRKVLTNEISKVSDNLIGKLGSRAVLNSSSNRNSRNKECSPFSNRTVINLGKHRCLMMIPITEIFDPACIKHSHRQYHLIDWGTACHLLIKLFANIMIKTGLSRQKKLTWSNCADFYSYYPLIHHNISLSIKSLDINVL